MSHIDQNNLHKFPGNRIFSQANTSNLNFLERFSANIKIVDKDSRRAIIAIPDSRCRIFSKRYFFNLINHNRLIVIDMEIASPYRQMLIQISTFYRDFRQMFQYKVVDGKYIQKNNKYHSRFRADFLKVFYFSVSLTH